MTTEPRGKAAKPSPKPRKSPINDFSVYFDVSIKVSDKNHAERIQRAIHEKCGFNMELLTCAR